MLHLDMFNRARADFAPFRGFSAESRAVVVNRARDQVERFMTDLEKHLEAAVKVIDTFDELDEVFNECEKNSTFNEQVDQEIVEQVNILNADYDQILTKGPPPVNGSFDLAIQINISEVESVVEEQKKWIAEPDTDSVVSIDTQVESHIPAQIEERVKTPPPSSPTPPVENKLATAVRRGRGRGRFRNVRPASTISGFTEFDSVTHGPSTATTATGHSGVKPTEKLQSWAELKQSNQSIETAELHLKKVDLARLHKMGEQIADPAPKSDDPWEFSSRRTIVLNEVKRRGHLGQDRGNLNVPVDGRVYYGKDGVAAEYIVIEAENLRAQGFNASQVGLDLFQCLFLHNGQGSGALFSNPRWFVLCTFGDAYREQGYDHLYHFIASTKALRCYDDDFTKLTNVRSPATICGICIIPGDPHSPPPKLCALTYYTKRGPNDTEQVIYQLEKFDISGGQMKNRSEKKQIKFLIELNNDTLTTNITQIECWGNQLYIVDSGRHVVYLTDLNGEIRRTIGRLNTKSTDDGQFTRPGAICCDSKGNFLIADHRRLQAFDCHGEFLTVIDFDVRHVVGLQLDDAGRLFCASKVDNEVYCYYLANKFDSSVLYERPMSRGSARFFGQGRGQPRGRGRGRGGRGKYHQTPPP